MLVYRSNLVWVDNLIGSRKLYLNILLCNQVIQVKNIKIDKRIYAKFKVNDFNYLGLNYLSINMSLHIKNIYNYYNRNTEISYSSLFSYINHLRKIYSLNGNELNYFIIDYESNPIRNGYMMKFENAFMYLRRISRSSGQAIFQGNTEASVDLLYYRIINKSAFDIKSNKSDYIVNETTKSDYLNTDVLDNINQCLRKYDEEIDYLYLLEEYTEEEIEDYIEYLGCYINLKKRINITYTFINTFVKVIKLSSRRR